MFTKNLWFNFSSTKTKFPSSKKEANYFIVSVFHIYTSYMCIVEVVVKMDAIWKPKETLNKNTEDLKLYTLDGDTSEKHYSRQQVC